MTRLDNLPHALAKATVGFDRLFDELEGRWANSVAQTFPPYNIVQQDENKYEITLAVAGFAMEDIEITFNNGVLTVEGTTPEKEEDVEYLHKGIAARSFAREFKLADHMQVEDATLENGMLTIALVREVPEALQPKKIAITARS